MFQWIDRILSYCTSLGGYAHPELRMFLRYSVGGGVAAAADIATVWLLVEKANVRPLVAGGASLAASMVINFIVARYWAFRSNDPFLGQMGKFVVVSLVGAGINYGSYALMVGVLHWWYILARVIAIGCAWVWNYRVNRTTTFKNYSVR